MAGDGRVARPLPDGRGSEGGGVVWVVERESVGAWQGCGFVEDSAP